MAISKRKYKKGQLSNTDKSRLFMTGCLCTVGAFLLCIEGWIPWIGSALYLAGLVNWLLSAFRSEKLSVVDHSEIMYVIPSFFIWLLWGKIETTMDDSYLIYAVVLSLILSALFIAADWYKKRRSSLAQYIGWSLLTVIFIFFLIAFPFFTQANVQLDPYEKKAYEGMVLDTERKISAKSTTKYSAVVSFIDNDGRPQQDTIRIKHSQYQQIEAGQKVIVIEGQGLFGADYWMIDVDTKE